MFNNFCEAKGPVDFPAFSQLLGFMTPGKVYSQTQLIKLFEQVG